MSELHRSLGQDQRPSSGTPQADGRQYIMDGTLLPCWSWASRKDLYSGKHKKTGMNVLVACTLEGRISWVSDPVPGSRHDNYIVKDSSVLDSVDPIDYVGDKGFVGNGMITPFKKPAGGELLDWQKEFCQRPIACRRWWPEKSPRSSVSSGWV
jgi:hypothetical protein